MVLTVTVPDPEKDSVDMRSGHKSQSILKYYGIPVSPLSIQDVFEDHVKVSELRRAAACPGPVVA